MVKKAISQMKVGKAPGPSGIMVEMIRAADDTGTSMIRGLAAAIIHDGKVPFDWSRVSFVCLYKIKRDAFERGNYHILKLTAGHESPGGEVVASFRYLGDMLSAASGCELNHNTWENCLEVVQGAASSSVFPPPLSRHMAMCTALVCRAQCSMPVRLGH